MAEAVSNAVQMKQNLLVEAGTGVGKSMAYLVPVVNIIKDNRTVRVSIVEPDGTMREEDRPRRVIVSTGTITLQKQLFDKELPLLKKLFPWLTYSMAVGSENYLCGARLAKAISEISSNPLIAGEVDDIEFLSNWSRETATGLRMDLPRPVSVAAWALVNRQSDLCRCKKWDKDVPCFYRKAKMEMNQANVILVNHHLLMAHLTIEVGTVLPAFDTLIIDEIHSLEEVATQCFGIEFSNGKMDRFVKDCGRTVRAAQDDIQRHGEIDEMLDMISKSSARLFYLISQKLEAIKKDSLRLRSPLVASIDQVEMIEQLNKVTVMLREAADEITDPQKGFEVGAMANRSKDIAEQVQGWLLQTDSDHVYQIASENGGKRIIAKSNPIDVSPYLKGLLWDAEYPVIGASATISTGGTMEFVKAKLGAEDSVELVLASPFNYAQNAIIYVASDLPEAKAGEIDPAYYNAMVARTCDLLKISQGRTIVLCTSNQSMKTLGNRLRPLLPDLNILIQGETMERHQMVEELRRNPKTVIIGVSSMWTGIDVAGDALQMIIITKLPFPNVGDPLFEAKCERVDAVRPGTFRSFNKISIPETIIKLKQGFGRLIRTSTDYGVVAILDTRVLKKKYGPGMIKALPPMYCGTSLAEVAQFLGERRAMSTPAPVLATEQDCVNDLIEEVPF